MYLYILVVESLQMDDDPYSITRSKWFVCLLCEETENFWEEEKSENFQLPEKNYHRARRSITMYVVQDGTVCCHWHYYLYKNYCYRHDEYVCVTLSQWCVSAAIPCRCM